MPLNEKYINVTDLQKIKKSRIMFELILITEVNPAIGHIVNVTKIRDLKENITLCTVWIHDRFGLILAGFVTKDSKLKISKSLVLKLNVYK